eukprot:TRINITY_DN89260_c0_g1_i1.p1 TRINITY_DN89260_c0_g1~~TRINITY_DN89260_c0_g1_i1.p1  ORF type:complete len:745 (-),score=89.90 TRINITY_DN89260_c0_g1_i1:216-2450(-)
MCPKLGQTGGCGDERPDVAMSVRKQGAVDKPLPGLLSDPSSKLFPLSCVGTWSLGKLYCEVQSGGYDDACAPPSLDQRIIDQKLVLVDEVVPWTAGDHISAKSVVSVPADLSQEASQVDLHDEQEDLPAPTDLRQGGEDISRHADLGHVIDEEIPGVANLGHGVLWQYCPWSTEGSSPAPRAMKELAKLTETLSRPPSASQLAASLVRPCDTEDDSRAGGSSGSTVLDASWVLVPEDMDKLDRCVWNGDGHYDMSRYPWQQPPSLGQVMTFLQLVDTEVQRSGKVLCLSSSKVLSHCAVLAGAVLVLARGLSAQEAWEKLLRTCPNDVANPKKAWDRFPPPFAPEYRTGPSSLSVRDCLAGLEFARDIGWIPDYQSFDVFEWEMLRRKLDASWLIPGKLLAMANPWGSSQNPRYPGLLNLADSKSLPGSTADSAQNDTHDSQSRLQSARGLQIPSIKVLPSADEPCKFDRVATPHSVASSVSGISMHSEMSLASPTSPGSATSCTSSTSPSGLPVGASESAIAPDQTKIYMENIEVPVQTFSFRITSRAHQNIMLEADHVELPSSLIAVRNTDTFMTYLQRTRVVNVFRLNKDFECPQQSQHENIFRQLGIDTKVCAFEDGGVPTMGIVKDFLKSCKTHTSTVCVAVHCMGGLGRTSCLVAAYAVSRFKMQGPAFHGWSRICRPGSVQTPEQESFIRALKPKAERIRSPPRGSSACGVLTFYEKLRRRLERFQQMGVTRSPAGC